MSDSKSMRYRLMPPGNPLAVWAVLVGVAGFCVPALGGLAAIVLGIMGLVRARRTLEGQPASIAGIILGLLSIACYSAAYVGYLGCQRAVVPPAH